MAYRYEIEVKLTSAGELKNVNWRHGPNRPYAVVWVDPSNRCSTRVDESGDTEANWDQTLVIPLPVQPLEDLTLYVDVVHAGSEENTKPLIGSAWLKLAEVLSDVGIGMPASKTLTLKRPSGRPHGKVDVKLTIREPGYRAQGGYYAPPYGVPPPLVPATGSRDYSGPGNGYGYGAPPRPAPVQGSYYSAVPPAGYPYGGGYSAPPPQTAAYGEGGYSAPPPQTAAYGEGGYGRGAAPVEEKKKSKFGGIGTGLAVGTLAGAVGGIALAKGAKYFENKVADDAAAKVKDDLGYDEGGYDEGGYDEDDF